MSVRPQSQWLRLAASPSGGCRRGDAPNEDSRETLEWTAAVASALRGVFGNNWSVSPDASPVLAWFGTCDDLRCTTSAAAVRDVSRRPPHLC